MIRNYLTIAFRSLLRNPVYSLINIAGLAIGICATILILLWIQDEITFNRYFHHYDDLYAVKVNTRSENAIITSSLAPYPLKDVLKQDSRIKNAAITIRQTVLLTVGEKKLLKGGIDASEHFLEMFDFRVAHGDPKTMLQDPHTIVLTTSCAQALFGTDDVVGRTLRVKIEQDEELKVSGVLADPPSNISFAFDFILPFEYFEKQVSWLVYARDNWLNNAFQYYVQLQPHTDQHTVDEAIKDHIKARTSDVRDAALFLYPMSHWRLYNNFVNGKESGGLINYVVLFGSIALFILVMACINFMNLATARSQHRSREVGIRKSIGSSQSQLIFQFIGESCLIAAVAFAISIALAECLLPLYNALIHKKLFISYDSSSFWLFSVSIVIITGVLAGIYPALYLSSFRPVSILKGNFNASKPTIKPRRMLVTFQNAFSILLLIGTFVVVKQINYLKSREPGYDRENLMLIWSNVDIEKNYHALKEELISSGAAVAVTKSNSPITRISATSPITWPGMLSTQPLEVTNVATEYDYISTMGIDMLEGRDFSPDFPSDTSAIILNRAAVSAMGMDDPVGQKVEMWQKTWTIIGVMDDVLMGSSSHQVEPMVMTMDPTWSTTISIRLPKSNDLPSAISGIQEVFKKYNPDYPFEYRFADVEFQQKFSSIEMISDLAGSFAMLAVIIMLLGLFGLASFTAEQRTKEIGIRKVLGASVSQMLILLSRDFSKLVALAFILSLPFGYWITTLFLEQYPVRIDMPWEVFGLAGVVTFALTILVVCTQAWRAATTNPANALKSE
jgi:predicted permease